MLFDQLSHDRRLGATPRPRMTLQQLNLTTFHLERYRFHSPTVILSWHQVNTRIIRGVTRCDGLSERPQKKRQRTAALQNLADGEARAKTRQRLGVRLSSAAFFS
jgi:hypothetical protein